MRILRTLFTLALFVTATGTMFGCAHNYYSIPQETLEKKVKTVGVAPFFSDAESDIRHPEKNSLLPLVQAYNLKNEKELIARLRGTGTFYAVRQIDADPVRLFSTLLASRERRDDAGVIYNKYFFKKDEIKQLCSENGLDAVMLVTVGGLTRPGKVYSSNFLSFLETDYNYLALTAQLIDREGNTLWEYPNFRRESLSYPTLLILQYPDFDEAAANLTEKVDVKFKTVPGISAAFAKTEKSVVSNGTPVSTLYVKQYDEMISLLEKYKPLLSWFGGKKEAASAAPEAPYGAMTPAQAPVQTAPAAQRVPAPAAQAAAPAPATPTPAPAPAPAAAATAPAAATSAPASEALPAPGGFTSMDIVPETPPAK